jgi:hypothetical protein
MSDINKGKYNKLYQHEFDLAKSILCEDGFIDWGEHDYVAFTFKNENVSLVFYPHRTSSYNKHIRVRDNGSKDKKDAYNLMHLLDEKAGSNCTFSHKARKPLADNEQKA